MSVDEADVPLSSDALSESSPPPSPVHLDHQKTASTLTAGSRQTYWECIAAIYQKKLDYPRSVSQGNLAWCWGTDRTRNIDIHGWVRERAAELLFEGGDVDGSSVAKVILELLGAGGSLYSLRIVNVDLRLGVRLR